MTVPDETKIFQGHLSLCGQGGMLAFGLQSVLISLSLHPVRKGWVLGVLKRNVTMAVVSLETDKFLESLIPLLELLGSEGTSCI